MIKPNLSKVSVAKAMGTLRYVMFIAITLLALSMISSCKGRTMNNMVPLGDTVEITPDTLVDSTATHYIPDNSDAISI